MVNVQRSLTLDSTFPAVVGALSNGWEEVLAAASLGALVEGIEVAHPVRCVIGRPRLVPDLALWTATIQIAPEGSGDGWFPRLDAVVEIRPVDAGVEVAIEGAYVLPAGPVGWMADRLLLHKVAEASIERYLEQVVRRIEDRLRKVDALTGVPG